jgi:hypothetical protein
VPAAAIFGTARRLEPPSPAEGFDALYAVTLAPGGSFVVAEWPGAAETEA